MECQFSHLCRTYDPGSITSFISLTDVGPDSKYRSIDRHLRLSSDTASDTAATNVYDLHLRASRATTAGASNCGISAIGLS